jgi:hypothetical protein
VPLFRHLTIRGYEAAVLWSYHTAADLGAWSITKQDDPKGPALWVLSARVLRADGFQLRQRPLLFTAWRMDRVRSSWQIERLELHGDGGLVAILGQPLQ